MNRYTPPPSAALSGAVSVVGGGFHTCAVMGSLGVRCWGLNNRGQLGIGQRGDSGGLNQLTTPPSADVLTGVFSIAAGHLHTCALLAGSGGVRCWGINDAGQLGDGTTTDRSLPGDEVLTGAVEVGAGSFHTCALLSAGGVRCWGGNNAGQLGDGTTTSRYAPSDTDVPGLPPVRAIAVGGGHTCALTMSGGVRCWGSNSSGALGDGSDPATILYRTTPTGDVLTDATAISAQDWRTCALLASGGVRCWGAGEAGDGTANRSTPTPADVVQGAIAVRTGSAHSCALLGSGILRCWGSETSGQLGNGDTNLNASAPLPVDVPAIPCP